MTTTFKTRYMWIRRFTWIARILSLLSIVVLLMFLFGEEFDPSKISFVQWIGFIFFPVGIVVGFVVAWKNELFGGTFSVISLVLFYLVYGLLLTGKFPSGIGFLIITAPAIFFIICGLLGKRLMESVDGN